MALDHSGSACSLFLLEAVVAMVLPRLLFLCIVLALPPAVQACWDEAARRHGVSADLLYAIANVESSLKPSEVNLSHRAQTGTIDIGLMGINTAPRVLKKLGVTEQDLYDQCTNINVGARILSEKFHRYGNTWEAIGAYNASCVKLPPPRCAEVRRRYAWRVYRHLPGAVKGAPISPPHTPLLLVRLQ